LTLEKHLSFIRFGPLADSRLSSYVLEMVAEGKAWETIVEEWGGSITEEAIAEAVQLASKSFNEHSHEHALGPMPA
jgi:heme oxygenase